MTLGYAITVPAAESISSARPIENRHRVSSHDLYQSISVLPANGFEKDLLQRDGDDIHRHRIQPARLIEDPLGTRARQHRQHTTLAPHPLDTRRQECRLR